MRAWADSRVSVRRHGSPAAADRARERGQTRTGGRQGAMQGCPAPHRSVPPGARSTDHGSLWCYPSGLVGQINAHNKAIRERLHAELFAMSATDFEQLVGKLLGALGFEQVQVTKQSGDGGIDVYGTLIVGEVISIKMAVQVKRWKNNVQAPTVQQVRGSLGAHDQGLIITTSDFSAGARAEAAQPNKTPVALMSGDQLVRLLIEHGIMVQRTEYHLLQLAPLSDSNP